MARALHFVMLFVSTLARAEPDCWVLRSERLFDGTLDGYRKNSQVRVARGRVVAIEPRSESADTKGCAVLDLGSAVLLPGLIDLHTHLFLSDRTRGADFGAELLRVSRDPAEERAKAAEKHASALLRSGFTTLRDLGNSARFLDVKLRDRVRAGTAEGPRLVVSGPGLAVKDAQFPAGTPRDVVEREYTIVANETDLDRLATEYRRQGADLAKLYADNDPGGGRMPTAILSRAVTAFRGAGLRVAVHATDDLSARAAVEAGAESIEHGFGLSDETLKLMAAKGTVLVPTAFSKRVCGSLAGPKIEPCGGDASSLLKRARARGVSIGFGSDMYLDLLPQGLDRAEATRESLYAYVEQGLSKAEALRAATSEAAKVVRADAPVGSVVPGASADLIAIAGDPLNDLKSLANVVFVMRGGKVICGKGIPCR